MPPKTPNELKEQIEHEQQKPAKPGHERTAEGKAWKAWVAASQANERLREASPHFRASVSRDGTFRIDDVPDGDYTLTVRSSRHAAGNLPSRRFSVPKDGTNADHPLDLGVLALE